MISPRFVQFTPSISFGDAVSNDVFSMSDVLSEMGLENVVVAMGIAPRVKRRVLAFDRFKPRKSDVFIYHMSIGSPLTEYIISTPAAMKIMVYHNITPASFWGNLIQIKQICEQGREQLKLLQPYISLAVCDSDYNREELIGLGYRQTVTLPIMFDRDEYLTVTPSEKILRRYRDGTANILFVGRIAPNKRQEDLIRTFSVYNSSINANSRLLLVGSDSGTEGYRAALTAYASSLGMSEVVFSGHVSFPEIVAYYRCASVFLCESEHEGFCVPLLEAMTFDLPIIAYGVTAVDTTMGKSGVKFYRKEHKNIAELIDLTIKEKDFRDEIIKGQQKRLADFDLSRTKSDFSGIISAVTRSLA